MTPPSDIIYRLLVTLGLGTDSSSWPIWVGMSRVNPDAALIVYDTAGVKDGRLMRTGEIVKHPGVQIRVRGPEYLETRNKAEEISRRLSQVQNSVVEVSEEESYNVVNVTQTGDIQSIGYVQEGDRTNHNFTVNLIVTIEER